jgi:hypothetical protein
MHGFAERQPPFEHAYGLRQGPLAQGEMAHCNTRPGKAVGVLNRLGQPEGVLAVRPPLGKRAELRKAHGQESAGEHRLYDRSPKTLPERCTVQDLDVPSEHLRCPPIVAQGPKVDFAQVDVCGNLQADISQGCGYGQSALGVCETTVKVAQAPQTGCHIARELSQSAGIAQGLSQGFRLAQVVEDALHVVKGQQRIAQVEVEINGLLARVATVREMLEGHQTLLKGRYRLLEGRAFGRLGARLPTVAQRLVPDLTPDGMVCQSFDLVGQAVGGKPLDGVDNLGVERSPPLPE